MTASLSIDDQVDATLAELTDLNLDKSKIGLAVSGGGDSIAMLHLMAMRFGAENLHVISVNHGLRAEAAQEIELVQTQCAALDIQCSVSDWAFSGAGNLQGSARAGRWEAIRTWARELSLDCVMLGHTSDDEVETFMMRLSRGSGLDGLSGMRLSGHRDGLVFVRPLLRCERSNLRDWLRTRDISWADDPSNDDPRYDRVKARQMLGQLDALGLTSKRIIQTIAHLAAAQDVVDRAVLNYADECVQQNGLSLEINHSQQNASELELFRRTVIAGLQWVSGAVYKPRLEGLDAALEKVATGKRTTISGCILEPKDGGLIIFREENATVSIIIGAGETETIWDNRWEISGSAQHDYDIRALGQTGLNQCPNWRDLKASRLELLSTPSVWSKDTLIAAPIAGINNGWSARIAPDFKDWLVTH